MPSRIWMLALALVLVGCPPGSDDDMADDDDLADDDSTAADDDDSAHETDDDGDGWSVEAGDCDDGDPEIHPDAQDIPFDGIDQDCDGSDWFEGEGDG